MARKRDRLPPPDINQITDLKNELKEFYSRLRLEQETDQQFYDDEFEVGIRPPYHVVRTGSAAQIIRTITQHITTSNPQVFYDPKKKTSAAQDSAKRVSILLNNWAQMFIDQLEEACKNQHLRGEGFFQINFDENENMPFITAPDPMIIYAYPNEKDGIPSRVIKYCKMSPGAVKQLFPNWSNPRARKSKDGVEYLAYWDKDWRYFEADGEPLLSPAIQPNLFGFVPFVHFYSQFGKDSPEGKPESKAVSAIRHIRGLLIQECEHESRMDSIIALWANPYGIFEYTVEGIELSEEEKRQLDLSPGHNIEVPYGVKFNVQQGAPPPPEMFAQGARLRARLGLEAPPVAFGMASTGEASGRQEDIYSFHFSTKYRKSIINLSRAYATALSLCLQLVDTIPGALPIAVDTVEIVDGKRVRKQETIIDSYYRCKVELKPEDELTGSRELMKYRMLANEGRISWKTLLVKGLGMSEAEADEEIDEALAEQAWRTNPMLGEIIIREAMERLGLQRQLQELDEQAKLAGKQATVAMPAGLIPERRGEPRRFTGNPLARESIRQMLMEAGGVIRKPPEMEA
jgi:hypothetical protein